MGKYSKKYVGEKSEYIVDPETGEIKERKVRIWSYETLTDKDFVKFFDAFVMDLLQDKEISGKAIRLLFYIASILDFDDEIFYLSPREVAKELNVGEATVYRWIKTLVDKGIILKTNRRNWYAVNRKCIYKGSAIRSDLEKLI